MWKISALVWIMLGTVLAGCGVLVLLAAPGVFGSSVNKLILPFALGGFVIALPIAHWIAKQITANFTRSI